MSVTINDRYAKNLGGLAGAKPLIGLLGQKYGYISQAVYNVLNKYGSNAHLYLPAAQTPVLGPELVVNGGFDDASWWQLSSWTIGSGVASASSVANGNLVYKTGLVSSGKTCTITYTVTSVSAGGVAAYINGAQGVTRSTAGTYTETITAGSLNAYTGIVTVGTTTASVDNISVREILSYSDTISGFHTGNYLDSAGTTVATVDNPVGLVLDGAGSVSATELVTNGSGSTTSGWTGQSANLTTDGQLVVTSTGAWGRGYQAITTVVGKTYQILCTADANGKFSIGSTAGGEQVLAATSAGRAVFVATTTTSYVSLIAYSATTGTVAKFSAISVREVTGIHASQATAGFKPVERRGIVNLLTYSQDFSNAAWVAQSGAVKSGNELSVPSVGAEAYQQNTIPAGAYTYAIILSGTGTCSLSTWNATDGISYTQVTLTATPTIYVHTRTPTVANTQVAFGRNTGDTATSITFGGAGLFQGTLTASQILSYGGIPLTTTAAASSSGGNYFWQFDGVDDRISLGAPLFQMSDDHCVVAGAKPTSLGVTDKTIFAQGGSTTVVRSPQVSFTTTGNVQAVWRDDASSASIIPSSTAFSNGQTVIMSVVKIGNAKRLRVGGVQQGSVDNTAMGATTVTSYSIGSCGQTPYDFFAGSIYPIIAIKGTVSDADLLTLEKWVGQMSGVTL
jgi:hypothetical protein